MKLGNIDCIKEGDVFEITSGTITVIHYENAQKIYVKHNDEHSHCMWTSKTSIRRGRIKNPYHRSAEGVGYIGVGKHKGYFDGKTTIEYSIWRSMLVRVYNINFLGKNPTYIGCTVCEEWHNFQNFAEWYTGEDEYGKSYHLDKDILVKGNKHYSPETCCLVPQEINSFFSKVDVKEGLGCKGVKANKNGTYSVKLSLNGKSRHLGTYKTLEEASYVYSNAKGIRAKELALNNLGNIRYKVFLAIMNWEF